MGRWVSLTGEGTGRSEEWGRLGTGRLAARESTGTGRKLASRDVSEPKTSQGGTFTMALNPKP